MFLRCSPVHVHSNPFVLAAVHFHIQQILPFHFCNDTHAHSIQLLLISNAAMKALICVPLPAVTHPERGMPGCRYLGIAFGFIFPGSSQGQMHRSTVPLAVGWVPTASSSQPLTLTVLSFFCSSSGMVLFQCPSVPEFGWLCLCFLGLWVFFFVNSLLLPFLYFLSAIADFCLEFFLNLHLQQFLEYSRI
jgi:hypothetical protein